MSQFRVLPKTLSPNIETKFLLSLLSLSLPDVDLLQIPELVAHLCFPHQWDNYPIFIGMLFGTFRTRLEGVCRNNQSDNERTDFSRWCF